MTNTLQHVPTQRAPEPGLKRRGTIRLIAALAAAVVVAVTIGVVLTRHDSPAGAQQLTSTERACQQWTGTYAPPDGTAPSGAWCTAMTRWMGQQLRSGHMTGPMMWGDAASMRSTCRLWMATEPAASSGVGPQACDAMVGRMAQHAGSWSSWMMTGRVTGGGMMGEGS
jgi:hypothetical protein